MMSDSHQTRASEAASDRRSRAFQLSDPGRRPGSHHPRPKAWIPPSEAEGLDPTIRGRRPRMQRASHYVAGSHHEHRSLLRCESSERRRRERGEAPKGPNATIDQNRLRFWPNERSRSGRESGRERCSRPQRAPEGRERFNPEAWCNQAEDRGDNKNEPAEGRRVPAPAPKARAPAPIKQSRG